jgi:hypothetical protein
MHQNQQMLKQDFYLLKYQHTTYYFGQKIQDSSRNLSINFILEYSFVFAIQSFFDSQLHADLNTNKALKNFHINNQIINTNF